MKICKHYVNNKCTLENCKFAHIDNICRDYFFKQCIKENCRFCHDYKFGDTIDITKCNILDIYSGSGNISYEFASRGAKKIISVDSNRNCIKFINKIAKDESFPISTFQCKAEKFIEKSSESFAIIFADPPYKYSVNNYKYIIEKVLEKKLLKENGIIIIEHDKKKDLSAINSFKEVRNYGGCCFSFFE